MANVFERIGKVAQAEWSNLRRKRPADDLGKPADDASLDEADAAARSPAPLPTRPTARAVSDVDGALRVLELVSTQNGAPTLDEVRARYRTLARRYQPKTQSPRPDEAQAAHAVMDALTEALELLEEHLLPLPP